MTTISDPEWDTLSATWRAEPAEAVPVELHRLVVRRTRGMVALVGFEMAITAAAIWFTVFMTRSLDRAHAIGVFLAVGAHTGAVWIFAFWNRRGIWRPLVNTTEGFVALSRERCRRQLDAVRFAGWLLGIEAVAGAGWLAVSRRPLVWGHLLPVVTLAAVALAVLWVRRRAVRELAYLGQFADSGGA